MLLELLDKPATHLDLVDGDAAVDGQQLLGGQDLLKLLFTAFTATFHLALRHGHKVVRRNTPAQDTSTGCRSIRDSWGRQVAGSQQTRAQQRAGAHALLAAGCSSYEPDLPVRHWVVRVGVEHDDGKGQQVGAVGCTWRQFRHSGWEAVKGKLGKAPQSSVNHPEQSSMVEHGPNMACTQPAHDGHSHRRHAASGCMASFPRLHLS